MNITKLAEKLRSKGSLLSGLEKDLSTRTNTPEVGLLTLPKLTTKIHGFPKGLTIVASRTSHGKTAFCTQIALDMGKQSIPSIFLSLEDTEESILERMFVNEYQINNMDLLTGHFLMNSLYQQQWDLFKAQFVKFPVQISCGIGRNMSEVNAYLEALNPKPKVVILDYVQMIRSGFKERENLSEYVRQFRQLMIENGMRGIVCSQIVRDKERQRAGDNKPILENLKGTGSLEEAADLVLLCYWGYFYSKNEEDKHHYEIMIAKNKKGNTGYFSLLFKPESYRFEEKE